MNPHFRVRGSHKVKYRPFLIRFLTLSPSAGQGTVLVGQFYWGGILPKSNGGLRRFSRPG